MNKEQIVQNEQYEYPYHYIPQYRSGFSQTYNWIWGRNYISAIEFILGEIKKDSKSIKSIVDVGCGDGRLTKELAFEFKDKHIAGYDYSKKAIDLAKAINPNLNFIKKNIINDPAAEQFDAISLVEVFEHIPIENCEDFVKGLVNLLNKDGRVYLTVPHKNKSVSEKHFQHFNYKSLTGYFEQYFRVEEVVFFDKLTKWNRVINLILVNKLFILNSRYLNNLIFKIYKKYFFVTKEKNCGRIYLKLAKK
jgi:2-polyprenyl-3-methyl-5-hydroxy-6-metoxy-1,4-benzoquinol methylase